MSIELLRRLVELVPEVDGAKMAVDIAGLPSDRIDFSGSSKIIWHKILREAERHNNGILKIIDSVLEDYPEDKILLRLKSDNSQNGTPDNSKPNGNSNSSDIVDKNELKTFVAQNKMDKVLKFLATKEEEMDSGFYNEIILLQARLTKLESDNLNGIKTTAEFNLEKNTLNVSLLNLIDKIFN